MTLRTRFHELDKPCSRWFKRSWATHIASTCKLWKHTLPANIQSLSTKSNSVKMVPSSTQPCAYSVRFRCQIPRDMRISRSSSCVGSASSTDRPFLQIFRESQAMDWYTWRAESGQKAPDAKRTSSKGKEKTSLAWGDGGGFRMEEHPRRSCFPLYSAFKEKETKTRKHWCLVHLM